MSWVTKVVLPLPFLFKDESMGFILIIFLLRIVFSRRLVVVVVVLVPPDCRIRWCFISSFWTIVIVLVEYDRWTFQFSVPHFPIVGMHKKNPRPTLLPLLLSSKFFPISLVIVDPTHIIQRIIGFIMTIISF
jgi:hypothetical protein